MYKYAKSHANDPTINNLKMTGWSWRSPKEEKLCNKIYNVQILNLN